MKLKFAVLGARCWPTHIFIEWHSKSQKPLVSNLEFNSCCDFCPLLGVKNFPPSKRKTNPIVVRIKGYIQCIYIYRKQKGNIMYISSTHFLDCLDGDVCVYAPTRLKLLVRADAKIYIRPNIN